MKLKRKALTSIVILMVSLISIVSVQSIQTAEKPIDFTVNWHEYDDNEDSKADRIDITYMLWFQADIFVIVDSIIHVRLWNNTSLEYKTVEFITDHHESFNTAGNGEGYTLDFRPEFEGQYQINVRIFMNNSLELSETIDWYGWKSDITEKALDATWLEYDEDEDGFKDTINIYFRLQPNTTGIINVNVNSSVFLLNESSINLEEIYTTFYDSTTVESSHGAIISVNITLRSPLTGDLVIKNRISIQSDIYGFSFGLTSILWENANKYGNNEPHLKVVAYNLDETKTQQPSSTLSLTSSSIIFSVPGLMTLDEPTLLIVTLIGSIIALLVISIIEKRK